LYNDYGVRHHRAWKCCRLDRSHKLWGEADRVSVVREIRMLRLTRRELETGPQGTAPVLDPTLGGLGLATAPGYPVLRVFSQETP
jgi:hypothetical protein